MVIHPKREKGEPLLPPRGLLLINPGDAARALKETDRLQGRRYRLFNASLGIVGNSSDNGFFAAGPAVGAPMAVITLEKLIALGARRIIVFGWCGALTERLAPGDLLIPTEGISSEGTSPHYPGHERPQSSTRLRSQLAGRLEKAELTILQGPVWTTDAPYRESRQQLAVLAAQGILAVDMEYTALCTVALFRGVELAAVFVVSDEPWRQEWDPAYRRPEFQRHSRAVLDILFQELHFPEP